MPGNLKVSTGLANGMLGNEGIDASFDGGVLEIRSGSQPSSPDDAPTGTLLASITIPTPSFNAASGGNRTKNGTWTTTASTGGTAAWFRLRTSGDGGGSSTIDKRMDGNIGTVDEDLVLNSAAIGATDTVTVDTATLSFTTS